jgi:hypothetical protein
MVIQRHLKQVVNNQVLLSVLAMIALSKISISSPQIALPCHFEK